MPNCLGIVGCTLLEQVVHAADAIAPKTDPSIRGCGKRAAFSSRLQEADLLGDAQSATRLPLS